MNEFLYTLIAHDNAYTSFHFHMDAIHCDLSSSANLLFPEP